MTTMADDLQREVSKTSVPSDDIEVSHLPKDTIPHDSVHKIGDERSKVGDKGKAIDLKAIRPPIVYDSPGLFVKSVARRFKSLWTRRFIFSLLAGQLLSLCITSTSVVTTELTNRNFNVPTTQTWFLYFSLFIVYTPYTIYKYGFKGWFKVILKDGWKYIILAASDVEGNFLVVKAYQSTNILSCMLLDCWAITSCMLFTWVYFRTKFHWSQYLGVFICIVGLGLLVTSDQTHNSDGGTGKSKLKGDLLMLAGSTLYGFTNATEEFFVRKAPIYQIVGQMGMWGVIINGIQAAALEHKGIKAGPWDAHVIGYLIIYTVSMFILYTVAPMLYRSASSTYFNISILSSDFYGLVIGIFVFQLHPYWLYFPAFAVVILGLIVYFWHTAPEEGPIDPSPPAYVHVRGQRQQQDDLEKADH